MVKLEQLGYQSAGCGKRRTRVKLLRRAETSAPYCGVRFGSFVSSGPGDICLWALPGRVEDWRAGLGRGDCRKGAWRS